jgi:hypothetical protein
MMDIDLQMEGVDDRDVAEAIRRGVRAVGRQFATTGEWRVAVWPAETRGAWDVGIRAPVVWHLDSFTGGVDGLPAFVERRLRDRVELRDQQAVPAGSRA